MQARSLDTTTFEIIEKSPAVKYFVNQALQHEQNFELNLVNAVTVGRICLLLEGLPLAIQIAAARIRLYAPVEMLERLETSSNLNTTLGKASSDAPDRHRSLQISLDWSYQLLSQEQRELFYQLSIFNGSFTIKAVEAVCRVENDPDLEGLENLLDKSLIRTTTFEGRHRFSMLVSIRQYSQEKLVVAGLVEELQRRHSLYYLNLAEEIEPKLSSTNQTQTLDVLEQDYPNFQAVLEREKQNKDRGMSTEQGLRLACNLWRFWYMRAYTGEGRRWLEQLLSNTANVASGVLTKAYKAAGTLAAISRDFKTAELYYNQGLILAKELDDQSTILSLLNNLGNIGGEQGNNEAAEKFFLESLRLARKLNQADAIGQLLNNLGLIARYRKDYNATQQYLEESLHIRRRQNDKWAIANTLSTLGDTLLDTGRE